MVECLGEVLEVNYATSSGVIITDFFDPLWFPFDNSGLVLYVRRDDQALYSLKDIVSSGIDSVLGSLDSQDKVLNYRRAEE